MLASLFGVQGGLAADRKAVAPATPVASLLRPRLVEALRSRFERRLTVVTAGAGFGKSTLIAQVRADNTLEQLGLDLVIDLRHGDRAPSRLLHRIGVALDLAVDVPSVDQITDAVWCLSPTSVALVFDDTHRLEGSREAWALLQLLVDGLPTNGHVVLSGRRRPDLSVARLQAQGEALVLTEDDLAFTPEELARLASQRDLPPRLASDLPSWPALATLMTTVGRSASIEYLWAEVIGSLSEDRRRVLAAAALFGELDDELVAGLDERWTAQKLVAGLPLVEGRDGGRVLLHDLWSDALNATLDAPGRAEALRTGARALSVRVR